MKTIALTPRAIENVAVLSGICAMIALVWFMPFIVN